MGRASGCGALAWDEGVFKERTPGHAPAFVSGVAHTQIAVHASTKPSTGDPDAR